MRLPSKTWEHPLAGRYASSDMMYLFSDWKKFTTWRQIWYNIMEKMTIEYDKFTLTPEQLENIQATIEQIDMDLAAKYEKELRHDVMAHVKTWGDQCPEIRPYLHTSLTSCDIVDNAELIVMREALELLLLRLARVAYKMAKLASRYADLPCLGFTHWQPAQPTTIGKRIAMWSADLFLVFQDLAELYDQMPFRGIKDATGTQQGLAQLIKAGPEELGRVRDFENELAANFSFDGHVLLTTGQTYSRLYDVRIVQALATLGSSAHKVCQDIRTLAMSDQMYEPFGAEQKGSSAQPYKQNPMRSERVCALAKVLMAQPATALMIHATQGLERTLDDSAARRMMIPEAFLSAEAICLILDNIFGDLKVFPARISAELDKRLPFMITPSIMTAMMETGADHAEVHEKLRVHSLAAVAQYREQGLEYDLLERITSDPFFAPVNDQVPYFMNPGHLVGLAPEQARRQAQEVTEDLLEIFEETELNPSAEDLKV